MAKQANKAQTTKTERRVIDAKLKSSLTHHFAEVTGGRKLEIGTKCEVHDVYVNRYGQDQARIMIGEDFAYINPKFLKAGKPLPAARIAELEAEREEQAKPTMVLGRVVRVSNGTDDKPGSVLLDYSGWFKPIWFGKDQIELLKKFTEKDGEALDGLVMAEVPAWKIKSGAGADSLAAIEGKQAEYKKMIK